MITDRSVTGIMHFMNQTLIDWYSRKQATVETAMYGSEFVAARTATDQMMDLRLTLRYLGVPICDTSYMFGDNKAVIDSSLTVLLYHTPSSTRDKMRYRFTEFVKPFVQAWLVSSTSEVSITLLMSSVNTGGSNK